MAGSAQKIRDYKGPVFYSHGFRPFFLFAGIWASFSMVIWVFFLMNGWDIPTRMDGVDWHMHEMIFGYTSAVIAGFLLTAVPNWTGRLPIVGWPTALLSGLWVLGRVALFFSAYLPLWVAPIVDISFLVFLAWVIGREITASKNWRNLKVMLIIFGLAGSNVFFHIEAIYSVAFEGYSIRLGVGLIIMLITIIGGRVIPSFTRNWLVKQGKTTLPKPRSHLDARVEISTGIFLLIWVLAPDTLSFWIGWTYIGFAHLHRLWRWVGWQTFKEPMIAILHVGYLFVPVGFFVVAARNLSPDAGLPLVPHAWMAGAIGVMTLAMMTRVSLGHTGRSIQSDWKIKGIYGLIVSAAVFRIWAEISPASAKLLHISASAWILAFAGFSIVYFPIFFRPRA